MFETEPNLIFWTIISFGILILLLYKVALPPLIKVLEERNVLVKKSIEEAEEIHRKNDEALKLYKEKLNEASAKAEGIIDTTKKEARSLQEKMLEQAKKESALIVQHANQEIDHQKNKAIEEIRAKTADLVIAATSKVLEKELNPEVHARIIEESLKEVEGTQ